MIAEISPERDVIVQRKAPKVPPEYLFKIQNVNEFAANSGLSSKKQRQHGKKKG